MAANRKTHRIPPALDLVPLAELGKLYVEHETRKEQARLAAFQRAWDSVPSHHGPYPPNGEMRVNEDADKLRVSLAVAFLGGGK